MQPTLSDVIEIARGAGEVIRRGYGQQHQVEYKGEIDLVTEVDKASEALILSEINARFAGHTLFTEESGQHAGAAEHVWYIDPLDGTLNYAHGMRLFCVSIAYAHQGDLTLGVIYDPLADELFAAERGQGAQLNGRPIRVSQVDSLIRSLLVTGIPRDARTNPDNNFAEFMRFSERTQGVRRLGSAALDLAYVAAGRLDGYWQKRLNAWDVAAGALLIQEAGGRVTAIDGGPDFLSQPQSILAANPALHPLMLEVLQED